MIDFNDDEFYAFSCTGIGDHFFESGFEISAEFGDVVVLEHDRIAEAYPVVVSASAADGVFFEVTPAWD